MSQFDRENNEVISLVNENHRRSNITQAVGVIVPMEEAEKIAVQNARASSNTGSIVSVILTMAAMFIVTSVVVFVLA